ncbi:MAG: matrixin family metalloprotease [Kofleriaceae bacterium]
MAGALIRSAVVVAVSLASASASTVTPLTDEELESGADRVVDATVIARVVVWAPDRRGLETHAVLGVSSVVKGEPAIVLEVILPGGQLEGTRHVVFGTPSLGLGERARWFLRARSEGGYRVFGWGQGKWPETHVDGVPRFRRAPVAAEHDSTVAAFSTNGMIWPASTMPVPYVVHNTSSDDLTLADEIAAIDAAFATWQAVPTASLAFANAGMTDLGMAVDGTNVILFIETGWVFGAEAAAATSLYIIDGQQTADIAVNGQTFRWAIGPPNSAASSNRLDLQAVLTHEIGHFSGLGHTQSSVDTMYFSWKPWAGQRTLSLDDKRGLSSIYPTVGDECGACLPEESCVAEPLGGLCSQPADPIGTPCNFDRVECEAFCLFTATNLSTGYCSRYCEFDRDCPLTHHCDEAMAGASTVKVCFVGPQPPPPPPCSTDDECAYGSHCDVPNGACTFECRAASDCANDMICDVRGLCASNGGCNTQHGDTHLPLALLVVCWLRRRRSAGHGRAR